MQIKAKICFQYETEEQAYIALKSLKPDDTEFVDSNVQDNRLICNLSGNSLKTILATTDDLLFCEMVVEKILEIIIMIQKK